MAGLGIEPRTFEIEVRCSTSELPGHIAACVGGHQADVEANRPKAHNLLVCTLPARPNETGERMIVALVR